MRIKTRLVIAAVAITGVIATIVHATPIVGLLHGTILSTGTDNNKIRQHVWVELPPAVGATSQESEDPEDEWTADIFTSGPSNVIVQDVVYAPGGHTGWHSHPGILLSSVISGRSSGTTRNAKSTFTIQETP